ncbi:ESCRT-III subunit protein snf7 [Coemansia sp. RSA 2336]|nr:ESCRT-III subunit protein snf7 [Coemansia sp. RSA 2336]
MDLFFKKKVDDSPKAAIIKLRETKDMLDKRERHLQTQIDNQLKTARANAVKNKRLAMAALKRKKTLETQMENISNQILAVDTQIMTIESSNLNAEAFKAMQQASLAMKKIHQGVSIDKVDQVTDDINEQMSVSKEISEAMTSGFGMIDMDEDELNAELEELEQLELDEQLLGAERTPVSLPQVPVSSVPQTSKAMSSPPNKAVSQQDEDDEELKQLRESMGMLA